MARSSPCHRQTESSRHEPQIAIISTCINRPALVSLQETSPGVVATKADATGFAQGIAGDAIGLGTPDGRCRGFTPPRHRIHLRRVNGERPFMTGNSTSQL